MDRLFQFMIYLTVMLMGSDNPETGERYERHKVT
jgi:hypothetical protein